MLPLKNLACKGLTSIQSALSLIVGVRVTLVTGGRGAYIVISDR